VVNIISLVSLFGVIVPTVAMICTLSVFNGLNDLFASKVSVFDPELKILPAEGKVFDPETPDIKQVYALPEIELYSEILQENALIKYADRQVIGTVKGVDSAFHAIALIDTAMIEGKFQLEEGDVKYAILGIGTATSLGVNASFMYPLEILIPKRTGNVNTLNPIASFHVEYAQIGGVYYINQPIYDEGFMIVPIDMMRSMLDYENEVSAIEIKTKSGTDISILKGKIKSILGSNFWVKDRYEQQEASFKMMQMEKWVTYLMLCFLLALALFNLIGSISILMIEKKEDIGKLQSMGADNKFTNRIFLFEGWMITIIGAMIGMVVGLALCWAQEYFGLIKLGHTAGAFIVDAYPVKIKISDIIIILLTVISVGFLTALYPVHFLGRKLLRNKMVIFFLIPLLTISCSTKKDYSENEIAVTIEPVQYFADKIAGNNMQFFAVVPVGQSPEAYDPTPREMVRISKSKAFFKIGQFPVEDIILNSFQQNNPDFQIFNMSEEMKMLEEDHGHTGVDPHIWTSMQGAKTIAENIYKALIILDKDNTETYRENYEKLISEIEELNQNIHNQLNTVSSRCFVIYHPALSYFAEEFDFQQLSIEENGKEPSPASLKRLIEEAKAAKARVIFMQKEFNTKYAKQIAGEIDAKIVEINLLDYQWEEQIKKIVEALCSNGETD
jgi:ABC-type Zn uptake system ZnuABC Zn-binding protein ZnuA/ABC-type lipoprotein release transport system permease subunit